MITRKICIYMGFMTSLALLSGCNSDKGTPGVVSAKSFTTVNNASTFSGEPRYVIDGTNATVQYWTDSVSGDLTQALVSSKVEPVKTRVIYDPQTNMPNKIIDENTGNYVEISGDGTGRVNYLEYDSRNRYQVGHAVFIKDDKVFIGEIAGKAAFSGQLFGQLSGGSKSGSYTLIATDASDLINIREADAQIYDVFDNLFGTSTTTSYTHRARGSLPSNLSSVLRVAGVALVVGSATVMAPAYGAAGVAMILSAYGGERLDKWIAENFSVDMPQKQEAIDISLSYLVDEGKNKISDLWSDVKFSLSDATQRINDSVTDAKNNVTLLTSLEDFDGSTSIEIPSHNIPQPIDAPPVIATQLVGQAAQSDGSVYMLTGSIDGSGIVKADGPSNNGNNQSLAINGIKDLNGTLAGSYVTRNADGNTIDRGDVDGREAALGTCQTATGSGGQGTFSFSHVVGSGNGVVDFTYDAYNIPDAFTVSSASGQKFSTGGLVSGANSISINIVDEPVVFVSVTAPNSGTKWEYELGCLAAATTATSGVGAATDQEVNNTVQDAQVLGFSRGTVTGSVNSLDDTDDIFSFVAASTGAVTISLSGFSDDLDLYLAPENLSTQYASNNSDFGTAESITQTLIGGNSYYVQVQAYDTPSATNNYTLRIQ